VKDLPRNYDIDFYEQQESHAVGAGNTWTLYKIEGKAGFLKQIALLSTGTSVRVKVNVDGGDYQIEYPQINTVMTTHSMTTPYAPQSIYSQKSAGSPYGLNITYKVAFNDSIEIIIANEGTASATISNAFIVSLVESSDGSKKEEKVWAD
jgi:hypothetical protein